MAKIVIVMFYFLVGFGTYGYLDTHHKDLTWPERVLDSAVWPVYAGWELGAYGDTLK